ncbi:MAG: hypothetical protein H0V70_10800 [Ktedonobacteraceae bacterium]|nr:hypothetical protein [Ktedonobacteraceae bacterium]
MNRIQRLLTAQNKQGKTCLHVIYTSVNRRGRTRFLPGAIIVPCLLVLVTACGPAVNQVKPQQTVTVNKAFQTQATPLPTVPPYRCGAWASNNAPTMFSTILILAKLTQNIKGVAGATAAATVHFAGGDVTLTAPLPSDPDGMVSFTLPLQGRQPAALPTTVSVSFTTGGTTVQCSPAFFTTQ